MYGRAVRIAASLGGFIAKVLGDYTLGSFDRNAPLRAAELRNLLSGLGPSFVKIGQALSARPDLLPQVYLEALSDLQVRGPQGLGIVFRIATAAGALPGRAEGAPGRRVLAAAAARNRPAHQSPPAAPAPTGPPALVS